MTTASASMMIVCDGNRCLGFILNCGRDGFEAFDPAENSLGLFAETSEAAQAIATNAARIKS
jgi:hypothetical protein